jgi:hypothetical protein
MYSTSFILKRLPANRTNYTALQAIATESIITFNMFDRIFDHVETNRTQKVIWHWFYKETGIHFLNSMITEGKH